jgi:hypothetical protein
MPAHSFLFNLFNSAELSHDVPTHCPVPWTRIHMRTRDKLSRVCTCSHTPNTPQWAALRCTPKVRSVALERPCCDLTQCTCPASAPMPMSHLRPPSPHAATSSRHVFRPLDTRSLRARHARQTVDDPHRAALTCWYRRCTCKLPSDAVSAHVQRTCCRGGGGPLASAHI